MGLARYKDKKGIQAFTVEPESAIQAPSHPTGPTSSSAGRQKKRGSSSVRRKKEPPSSPATHKKDQVPSTDDFAAIDEPLILLRLAMYYNGRAPFRMYKFFGERIRQTTVKHNGWENYVAICMLRFFVEDRPLTDIFTFEQRRSAGGRLKKETRLDGRKGKIVGVVPHSSRTFVGVGCLSEDLGLCGRNDNQRPQPNLGYNSATFETTKRWVKTGQAGGLLFPDQNMGPDILFLLRLDDSELVWVAIQCKYDTPRAQTFAPATKNKQGSIRSTTPTSYYMPDSVLRGAISNKAQDDIEAREDEIGAALVATHPASDITGDVASHLAESPPPTIISNLDGAMSENTAAVEAVNDGVSALTALTESDAEEDVSEDLYGYLSGPAPSKDQAQLSVLSGKRRIGDTSVTDHAPEDAEKRGKKSRAKSRR
ncbi:hypothetical protein EV121DRAFT_212556 [Schizophyllum commune]